MPPPSWVQTWARRSRLRPHRASGPLRPHRAPGPPAAPAVVITLDDEVLPPPIDSLLPPPLPPAGAGAAPAVVITFDDEVLPLPIDSLPPPALPAAAPAVVITLDDEVLPPPIASLPPPPPAVAAGKREFSECIPSDDDEDEEEEEEEEVVDPQYQLFLDHLKPEGTTYRLEMPPLSLRYEDDSEVDAAVVPGEAGRKKNPGYTSDEEDEDYRVFTSHVRELPDGSMILEFPGNVFIRYEDEAAAEAAVSLGEDCGSGSVVDADEDYLFFIRHARQDENGAMVFELDDNVVVNYEGVGEGAPEVHVKTEDLEDGSGLTVLRPCSVSSVASNYLTYEDDGCSVETGGCEEPMVYGEKLKDLLDKPFDQSEYERLLQLAELCTPVEGLRETRSVSKTYQTNKLGRSYLDYFPKLGEMVKDADPRERLYLLRGLFFWLKNVAHEGSFKPWECASSSTQTLPSTAHIQLAIEIPEN